MRVNLTMLGSSVKNRHFVWSRAKELSNLCLIYNMSNLSIEL